MYIYSTLKMANILREKILMNEQIDLILRKGLLLDEVTAIKLIWFGEI